MNFIKDYIDILKAFSSLKNMKYKKFLMRNELKLLGSENDQDLRDFLQDCLKKETNERDRLKTFFKDLSLEEKKVFINFVWSCNISYLISLEINTGVNDSFKKVLMDMDKNNKDKYLKEDVLKVYFDECLEIFKDINFYHEVIGVFTVFLDDKNNSKEAEDIRKTFSEYKERVFYGEEQKNSVTYQFFNEYLKRNSCFLFGEFEKAYNQNTQYNCLIKALTLPQETNFQDVKYIISSTINDLFNDDLYENFTQQKIILKFYNFLNESPIIGDNEKIFLYNSIVKGYMADNNYHFVKLIKSHAPDILINKGKMLCYPQDLEDIKDSLIINVKYAEVFKKISNAINMYDHKSNRLDVDAPILKVEDFKLLLNVIVEVFKKRGVKIYLSDDVLKENLKSDKSYISFDVKGLRGVDLKKLSELFFGAFDYVSTQLLDVISDFNQAMESKNFSALEKEIDSCYEENISHLVEELMMKKDVVVKALSRDKRKW